jgi:hypothetical protein
MLSLVTKVAQNEVSMKDLVKQPLPVDTPTKSAMSRSNVLHSSSMRRVNGKVA